MIDNFKKLYENSPVPAILIDHGCSLVWRNAAAYKHWGAIDGINGVKDIFYPADLKDLAERVTDGEYISTVLTGLPLKSVAVSLAPIWDGSKCYCSALLFPNSSTVKAHGADVDRAAASFESAFRQSITAIFGFTGRFSEALEYVENIDIQKDLHYELVSLEKHAYRMLRNVSNVAEFARIGNGATSYSFKPENIKELFGELLDSAKRLLKSSGINFEYKLDIDDIYMSVNAHTLIGAVIHIISNASENLSEGGSVFVTVNRSGSNLMILVEDEGYGIQNDKLSRVFEPYFSFSQDGAFLSNLGIGLPFVIEAVKMHGGQLAIRSDPNGGCGVSVSIPIKEADPQLCQPNASAHYVRDRFSDLKIGLAEVLAYRRIADDN